MSRDGTTGSVLHRLSGEPGTSWSERLVHHGSRVALLVAVAVVITTLFPPAGSMNVKRYEVGMVAPEDVIAAIPFSVPKSADELARDRAQAMDAVPVTLNYVAVAADTMAARVGVFFDRVDTAVAAGDSVALRRSLASASILASPSQVRLLMEDDTRGVLRRAAERAAAEILPRGVLDAGHMQEITTSTVTVRDGDAERSVPAGEILSARDFFDRAVEILPSTLPPDLVDLYRLILIRFVEYSYEFNVVSTELDRDAAARTVATAKDSLLQGQAIVRKADPIDAQAVERLEAYEAQLRSQGLLEEEGPHLGTLLGAGLLNLLLLSIFGLMLFFFRAEAYANFRWVLLLSLLVVAYFGAAAAIAGNDLPPEWLPIAFVALPVGVMWDSRMALVLVFCIAAVTGATPAFSTYGTVLTVIAGGAAAAISVRAIRRRSEIWVSIAIISVATGLVLLGHGLATSREMTDVAWGTLYATGNTTLSALLAVGFMWVFELFTGITTDQTLLEWADPTRPLLKRLSLEAPGTYAHTINVANLAEAAANAIGANGLLCRVGIYYHDVGKMLKPHYFVENQPGGRNPHDKLKPGTSATIVREHVTEGVRLAKDAKVPEVITRFILEHHGTQRIGFFYDKALEEVGEDEVDVERFSYPGPKPQSRETALAMLADSCESATRALKEPTPERIQNLIETIVDGKIADGQLDEAPLTLRDITRVKKQFVKILTGVLHRRIDYPQTKHLTEAAAAGDTSEQAS